MIMKKRWLLWVLIFLVTSQLSGEELGRLRILSYNVFGVLIAPARKARMEKIGEEIARLNPDIIGFQEAFEERHRRILLESLEKNGWGKPYEFYQKKWYGPGAWIVSKFPLENAKLHFYPVNGTPLDSDYYGKKGIAYAQVMTPYGTLDFFSTHLIARYTALYDRNGNLKENDWLKKDRLLQAEQSAWFIQSQNLESKNRSLVAVGDFNSPPVLLEYKLFKALSGLNNVADETPILHCSAENEDCKLEERIDHIFYQNYTGENGFYLKPVKTELVFYEKVETRWGKIKLSDHNGLLTEFMVLSADEPGVKIAERSEAKIFQLQPKINFQELSRLKAELDSGKRELSDPLWSAFAVQALDQFNQKRIRRQPAIIPLAKIITSDQPFILSEAELCQLKKWLEPGKMVFGD